MGKCGIYSSACDAPSDTCAFAVVTGRFADVAAGKSWSNLVSSAPWANREYHTTVIDAAGAIYVIGGTSFNYANATDTETNYNDVWKSSDGGDPTRGLTGYPGGTQGSALERILRSTLGVISSYSVGTNNAIFRVLRVTLGVLKGTQVNSRGTMRILTVLSWY